MAITINNSISVKPLLSFIVTFETFFHFFLFKQGLIYIEMNDFIKDKHAPHSFLA